MCGDGIDSVDEPQTSGKQRLLGLLFGIAFGFLLQKGGVTDYDVLVGALLLRDPTVFIVMLSAIVVGMAGVFTMHGLGLVKLHAKPLRPAANVIGGLVFGAGFGLSGYCPGTGAGAFAQGNWDAAFAMVGLMLGSLAYAEASGALSALGKAGHRGGLLLTDVVRLPRAAVVGVVCVLLSVVIAVLGGWGRA